MYEGMVVWLERGCFQNPLLMICYKGFPSAEEFMVFSSCFAFVFVGMRIAMSDVGDHDTKCGNLR